MSRDVRQPFPSDEAAGAATVELLEEAGEQRSADTERSAPSEDAPATSGATRISLEELVSEMPGHGAEARPIVASTQRPAVAPTQRPAVAPTQRPAVAPTQRPAVAPTQRPAVAPTQKSTQPPGLRTARVVAVEGRRATVAMRGAHETVAAAIAPEVEVELIAEAAANRESALVEVAEDGEVTVVGLVQTRRPREVHVKGDKVVVEAEREVLLRAGRAALRLREDGDVELVGSRISAASRGLFRIVGRILRLN